MFIKYKFTTIKRAASAIPQTRYHPQNNYMSQLFDAPAISGWSPATFQIAFPGELQTQKIGSFLRSLIFISPRFLKLRNRESKA